MTFQNKSDIRLLVFQFVFGFFFLTVETYTAGGKEISSANAFGELFSS